MKHRLLRPADEPGYFRYIYILYGAIALPYIIWRLEYTVGWQYWLSPLLFVCDLYIICNTLIFLLTSRVMYIPVWRPPMQNKSVDVFIPTYNEPSEIVEMTTIGALHIRGVHKVFVLDDGNRPDIRMLAERLGATYLARKDNAHAKAGNLNHGLQHSDADFIICLDCDHVPSPHFIERTLGYFEDPSLGFIQTPQVFYNEDSIQHRKTNQHPLWNEQSMFYECIQPAKNRFNAAFFCGSGGMLRRSALDSVGGFATGTATEDIHTSLRLHAKGWKSLFIHERLAYGLAAEDLREYHRQRVRWGAGSLGLLFRSPDSPLYTRGLTFMQRLCYINSTTAYLLGIQKILYILAPIATIVFSTGNPSIPVSTYFLIHISFLIFSYMVTRACSRNTYHFPYTEQYDILNIFSHIEAIKGVIRVQKKFGVSIKIKRIRENSSVYYLLLLVLAFMVSANIFGIFFWFVDLKRTASEFLYSNIFIGIIWNSYNIYFFASALWYLKGYGVTPRNEHKFRILKNITIMPDGVDAHLDRMSLRGAVIHTHHFPQTNTLSFTMSVGDDTLPIHALIDAIESDGDRYTVHVTFDRLEEATRKILVLHFFHDAVPRMFASPSPTIVPAFATEAAASTAV